MRSKRGVVWTVVALAILVAVSFVVVQALRITQELADSAGKPCTELPPAEVAQATLEKNQELVRRLDKVRPNSVSVYPDPDRCPGRADIVVTYATVDDYRKLKQILGDDFDGVPYRLLNT